MTIEHSHCSEFECAYEPKRPRDSSLKQEAELGPEQDVILDSPLAWRALL